MRTITKPDRSSDHILQDIVRVRRRFLRSTNLERDIYSAAPLDGFVVTASALSALERVLMGIQHPHLRAISLTGPFGSGKSTFALYLTHLLGLPSIGSEPLRHALVQQEPAFKPRLIEPESAGLWPILVTGARVPLARSLVRALERSLVVLPDPSAQQVLAQLHTAHRDIFDSNTPTPQDVANLYMSAASIARAEAPSCAGLFLVIDEAGEFLQFAATHPNESDIFVLQELAEAAARSGTTPLLVMTVLHQAFDEYAHRLSGVQRTEWQKVQGRFADVPYGDGPDETVRLVAQAIDQIESPDAEPKIDTAIQKDMERCRSTGLFPPTLSATEFKEILRRTYPLHPIALRVIPFLFRRFGQSERSLFSFLSSEEPFGFQQFLRNHAISSDNVPQLRVHDLYDYVVTTLGSSLYTHATAKLWSETEEAVFRVRDRDPLFSQVIKTIGVLHILGEQTRILPSREVLEFALSSDEIQQSAVAEVIASLEQATLITYRQFRRAYRLYEGSDIDVEARLREARTHFTQGTDVVKVAASLGATPSMVARRHSFEKGTLRAFEVRYCRAQEMESGLSVAHPDADGLMLLCIASDDGEAARVKQRLATLLPSQPEVIVGVCTETDSLHEAAVVIECLRWVQENTPELRNDPVARREVRERLLDALNAFQNEWDTLMHPADGKAGTVWMYRGETQPVTTQRQLQHLLSDACDRAYPDSPRLLNELVNRRQISSTAAAGRRNLIEGMITKSAMPRLGIEGFPPEASMYVSLLEATGIHKEVRTGEWSICPPKDTDRELTSVWSEIVRFLFDGTFEPRPLLRLNAALRAKPYGLTEGVIPVLLCAALIHFQSDVAIYEEGRFITELDTATFERIIKRPEDYTIQGCRIAGERQMVLTRFGRGMLRGDEQPTLVNIVRQLYKVVNRLPEYTSRTKRLENDVLALRDLLKEGRQPEQLIFVDLPLLFGALPFVEYETDTENSDQFFEQWNRTMFAVTTAYDELLNRIEEKLCSVFDVTEVEELRLRSEAVLSHVTEPRLRAFAMRAADRTLDRTKWLESVAAGISGRPPYAWSDSEEDRFKTLVHTYVDALRHSELLMFEKQKQPADLNRTGLRLAITLDTGEEEARVVFLSDEAKHIVEVQGDALLKNLQRKLKGQPEDVKLAIIAHIARQVLKGETNG